jgi:hypothetical protein
MKMARTKNSNSIVDTRLGAISLGTNTGKVRAHQSVSMFHSEGKWISDSSSVFGDSR